MKKFTLFAALAAGFSLQANAQTQVLYLPFDGSLSNAVSGGNAAEVQDLSESYVDGKFGKAFNFPADSALNNALTVAHYDALKISGEVVVSTTENEDGTTSETKDYSDPAGSFSISLWLKTDGTGFINGKAYVLHSGTWGSAKNSAGDAVQDGDEIRWCGIEFQGSAEGPTKLVFGNKQPNGKKQELYFTDADDKPISSIVDGNWHHVVAIRDHENQVLCGYIDGVKCENANAGDFAIAKCYEYTMAHEAGLALGNSRVKDVNCEPFAGALDEVRIFRGVLSEEQIKDLYENNYFPAAESAISAVNASADVVSVDYFNLQGLKVDANTKGIIVAVYSFADGSSKTVKLNNK